MTARRFLLLFAFPSLLAAQGTPAPQQAERARLEGELRRGFARAVRQRVGLTDEQMRRLAPVTQRHEQERRGLQMEERRTRVALQGQLQAASPDTAEVARLLGALRDVHRRRLALMEAEDRDLATIMNPLQRARYLAIQEQIRRRVEQMRQGPPDRDLPGARRGRPPA